MFLHNNHELFSEVVYSTANEINIYKIMQNFNKLYDIMKDREKKNLISYLVKQLYFCPN